MNPGSHSRLNRISDPRVISAILAALVAAAYFNCLNNAFQIDDIYGIVNNVWIRSLRHIPRYFVDPFADMSLKSSADYRPIVVITFAINYAISGYQTWSWHALNAIIHWSVCIHVYLLGRLLIGTGRIRETRFLSPREGDWISGAAAFVFAVHPITTACMNYLWARSSLLAAAWCMPATVIYLRALRDGRGLIAFVPSILLFLIALLTKAEAFSFLGIVVLAELLLAPGDGNPLDRLRCRRFWTRVLPFGVIGGAYLVLRQALIPEFIVEARQTGSISNWPYFLTQLSAWWYYIGKLLLPINMVADETAFPVSRSIADTAVLIAGGTWLVVFGLIALAARRLPVIAFLALWYFITLAPTSSVLKLPEMVNEHRPYLPSIGLVFLGMLGIYLLVRTFTRHASAYLLLACAIVIVLGVTTHMRNRVWKDDLTLWEDTVAHSPAAPRAQMAYGLALMKREMLDAAELHLREAVRLSPRYHMARINLAVLLDRRGEIESAGKEYDAAVEILPDDSAPYYSRGLYRERLNDLAGAAADFQKSSELAAQPHKALQALARVLENMGKLDEAAAARRKAEQSVGGS